MEPPPAGKPVSGTWTTEDVSPHEAFAYWQDRICDTFVRLSASPTTSKPFHGRIDHAAVDDVELSTVRASGQEVRRTPRLIARSPEEYVLASIQLNGNGVVEQDDRVAHLSPGAMAFYDSTRPYTLHFAGSFEQLVVQVPRRALPSAAVGKATAVALDPRGSGRLVADFFVGLARMHASDPVGARTLAPHAVGLLTSALGLAARGVATEPTAALARQRVRVVLNARLADPRLSLDAVAEACHLSRRSLVRLFADEPEGVAGTLRRMRVDRARALLRADPRRPVAAIAVACGFAGEAQLHRAFRALIGTTPGAYRATGVEVGPQRQ